MWREKLKDTGGSRYNFLKWTLQVKYPKIETVDY